MAKRKEKFPDIVYIRREYDESDKSSSWLLADEAFTGLVDRREWVEFGVYKKVGTAKGKETVETKVRGNLKVRALLKSPKPNAT